MDYIILSACGWKSVARTQDEAIALADKHHRDRQEAGAPKPVRVRVYYRDGSLVYDTEGEVRRTMEIKVRKDNGKWHGCSVTDSQRLACSAGKSFFSSKEYGSVALMASACGYTLVREKGR